MTLARLWHSFCLCFQRGGRARADYIRRKHLYGAMGTGCSIVKRKIPLYANLIRIGNNVHIASNVSFLTHDVTHRLLNQLDPEHPVREHVGCIEVGNNVFIGSGVHILNNTKIGSNVIIGTCSIVTRDIPDNSVIAGVPARVIGRFDDFVAKMRIEPYPAELEPKAQEASPELAAFLWAKFDREHAAKKEGAR